MAYMGAVIAVLWAIFWLYWLISARNTKGSVRHEGYWRFQIGYRLVLILIIVVLLKVPSLRHFFFGGTFIAPNPALAVVGVLVCVLGLAFAVWARVNIGRNWGVPMSLREDPELVVTGPYRLVRHPIYGGIMIAMVGTALVAGKEWALVFLLILPYFVFSAFKEEQAMTQQFPEQYPEYKKETKMLIPYIW